MSMPTPKLYVFAISHYCEKARWALDYLAIDHQVVPLAPGIHARTASQLGAPRSSLPILVADGQLVQGSADIVDWAERAASADSPRLTPDGAREEIGEIERRLDEVAGIHVRRYYYSEALVDHPETVRPIFTDPLPLMQKLLVSATWGAMRKRMISGMDLGPEQGQASRRIVDGELSWLDGLLSDGRRYLVADTFSRADMAAASLLAPLAVPREHPVYAELRLPPNLAADLADWETRPSLQWVRQMYAEHR